MQSSMAVESNLDEEFAEIPFVVAVMTMINYVILTLVGHVRDFLRLRGFEQSLIKQENAKMKVGDSFT